MALDPTSPPADSAEDASDPSGVPVLAVYWRPGCPYCSGLRRTLKRHGVDATWHNIWEDDEARRFVAEANRGNETVPTVRVGTTTLTNPRWSELSRLLAEVPGSGVEPAESKPAWVIWLSWLPVVAAIAVSFGFDFAHETALSWSMDAVAVVAWWVTRPLRR